ncbi:MAG: glycerol-3-phosphate 1-O-acyltransferase PlsY [Candidatus Electryonea clarkiae]|nr:glycerol-3-phosphate 1-O-acyltransferase PlsY [Candidatus Electryonea clarkiae]MDP8288196.1 glycerol-3-phosphate 1-O-acyltransferase PlsY [Candidatus Electryonea clarkiae]
MKLLWALIGSYILGSFPTAYIVAKKIGGFDIFEKGSGNPGMSNVYRLMGLRWAMVVLTSDMLKGYLPVRLSKEWINELQESNPRLHPETIPALVGLSAVAGHIWPVTTRFHGGKGAATMGGVLVGIAPVASSVSLMIWAMTLKISKLFSVASLAASLAFPVAVYIFEGKRTVSSLGWGLIVPLILTLTHQKNIRRLKQKKETPMKMQVEISNG